MLFNPFGVETGSHLVALAVMFTLASATFADELRTLGGKTITGTITSISDQEITLQTTDGAVKTPLSQVLALDVRQTKGIPPGAKYSAVRLIDDTTLYCSKITFAGKDVEFMLLSGATIKAPLQYLSWMIHDANDPALKKKFDDILAQKVRRDRLIIHLNGELNPLEGTLGDVDGKGTTIQYKPDGADAIGVLFERVHGLIFYRTESPEATPICRVYDADGNAIIATKLGYENGALNVTTTFGAKVALKQETLAKLDFNLGKLTFLSDMEPAKVVEKASLGLPTPYRKDANLLGEQILLEKPHAKGLSLHAYTDLQYNLAGKYKEFKALLGVDPRYLENVESKALVTVYCDGEKRFSETVAAKPRPISLDVKDVNTLRIVVSSPTFLDAHHHATLADARVSQ